MLTEQHVRAGHAARRTRAARRCATSAPIDRVKDDVRDTWLSRLFETLAQDVRYGLRNLRRNPGFALVVILTMALGIGANTAIFSVVNGVLLRPLPYRNGDSSSCCASSGRSPSVDDTASRIKEILDYRRRAQSLDGVVEFHDMWFILLGRAEPERVVDRRRVGELLRRAGRAAGLRPHVSGGGRQARRTGRADASHKYWQRSFGGDPAVVGRIFRMNDRPHQVDRHPAARAAVSARGRRLHADLRVSRSARRSAMIDDRSMRMMSAFARVKPGVTMEKVSADLSVVAAGLQASYPEDYRETDGYRTVAIPLEEELTRSFKPTLLVLLGTAGFVLLIVCASVANLMLARMVRREREIAVRAALGASRTRLLRQLLTESTLLALIGGLLGLGLRELGRWSCWSRSPSASRRAQPRSGSIGPSCSTRSSSRSRPAWCSAPFRRSARRLGIAPALRDGGRATQNRQGIRSVAHRRAGRRVVHAAHRRRPDAAQPSSTCSSVDPGLPHRQPADDAHRSELLEVPGRAGAGVLGAARRAAEGGAGRHRGRRRRHVPAERPGAVQRTAPDRGA